MYNVTIHICTEKTFQYLHVHSNQYRKTSVVVQSLHRQEFGYHTTLKKVLAIAMTFLVRGPKKHLAECKQHPSIGQAVDKCQMHTSLAHILCDEASSRHVLVNLFLFLATLRTGALLPATTI
jgi:hypothetical protein